MVPVMTLREQARILRSLALDFSDPEICGQLMDLAGKCEAVAGSIAKKSWDQPIERMG